MLTVITHENARNLPVNIQSVLVHGGKFDADAHPRSLLWEAGGVMVLNRAEDAEAYLEGREGYAVDSDGFTYWIRGGTPAWRPELAHNHPSTITAEPARAKEAVSTSPDAEVTADNLTRQQIRDHYSNFSDSLQRDAEEALAMGSRARPQRVRIAAAINARAKGGR